MATTPISTRLEVYRATLDSYWSYSVALERGVIEAADLLSETNLEIPEYMGVSGTVGIYDDPTFIDPDFDGYI